MLTTIQLPHIVPVELVPVEIPRPLRLSVVEFLPLAGESHCSFQDVLVKRQQNLCNVPLPIKIQWRIFWGRP
jgi:hypothetical protein